MELAFRYPVVAKCVPKGKSSTRVGIFNDVSSFSVTSLASDQFAVVATYREGKEAATLFQSADGYYRRVGSGKPPGLSSQITAAGSIVLTDLIRQASDHHSRICAQEGFSSLHGIGWVSSPNKWEPITSFNGDVVWDDVGYWRALAESHLTRNVVLIDGQLFMRCPEPVVCVKRAAGTYAVQMIWHDDTVTIETTKYHFPLSATDLAVEFAGSMSQASGIPVGELDFDVINADFATDLAYRLDAGNCIKALYNSLNNGMADFLKPDVSRVVRPYGKSTVRTFDQVPDTVLECFMCLKKVASKPFSECAQQELELGMEAVDRLSQLASNKRWSWIISNPHSVKIHLEKWDNRDVSVDLIASAPLFVL